MRGCAAAAGVAGLTVACSVPGGWELTVTPQESGTDALLQAVSPVSARVVWVSGHRGTYARTTDGGTSWVAAAGPALDTLQFRDVAAFDAATAYLMSAGSGALSRIYRTDDGGRTWGLQYLAADSAAFLDCMDFWTPDRGLAYGDAIDGVPFILGTEDGATWSRVPAAGLPRALEGEGGFAASGTCLVVGEPGHAWIATGNGPRARVLSTDDWGATWSAVDVPVAGGTAAGLTTIATAPDGSVIALGGVIGADTLRADNVAVSVDGGGTWEPGGRPAMAGPAYGSALLGDGLAVAVGPGGIDASVDGGRSWQAADTLTYWAVGFAGRRAGWAVGPQGRITKLAFVRR